MDSFFAVILGFVIGIIAGMILSGFIIVVTDSGYKNFPTQEKCELMLPRSQSCIQQWVFDDGKKR